MVDAAAELLRAVRFNPPGRVEVEVNDDGDVRAIWKHELTRIRQ